MTTCYQVNNLLYAQLVVWTWWNICMEKIWLYVSYKSLIILSCGFSLLYALNLPSLERKHILNTNNNLNLKWETIHKTSNITNYELFVQFVFENLQNIINSMYWSIVACCKYVIVELFTCWEQFKIWRWEFSFVGDLIKNLGNTNMELLQNVIS